MHDRLYAVARIVVDEAFGSGAYAEHNKSNPDPRVQEQVAISKSNQGRKWLSHMIDDLKYEPDLVLKGMAAELREALLANGLDPKDPPTDTKPPIEKAWGEYLRRGGEHYKNPDEFIAALIERVGSP